MKIRAFEKGEDKNGQLVARLLSFPRKLLVTILMLNVLMNILIQNVVSSLFGLFSGWFATVGVPLIITLILGEMIPKSIALSKNEKIAPKVAPVLMWIEWIIAPIRNAITFITNGVSRVLFFYLHREKEISIDELKHALRTSQESGVLTEEEAKLMRGYLNLEEDVIKEIMCPRQEVIFFDIHEPLSKLTDLFVDQGFNRIPICDGSLEKILGIMSSGSYFLHKHRMHTSLDLTLFLHKPCFVPESLLGKALLRRLYSKEEDLVIVIDEYGSVSGIVTLEDILEIVIGQFSERKGEKTNYTQSSEDVIIASGKLELTEFEEIFDVHLDSPNNMATIGGWLMETLGDIPKTGTKYETNGFLFYVLASDVNRVRRVYIRRLTPHKKK